MRCASIQSRLDGTTLLPRLAVDLSQPPVKDLSSLFSARVDAVQLEIGFGGGEHLAAQAAAHPGLWIHHRMRTLHQRHGQNAGADRGAGPGQHPASFRRCWAELLEWLPAGSLGRVDLLYPDPWPKRRHWKRRFIQDERISILASRTRARVASCASQATYPNTSLMDARALPANPACLAGRAERADDHGGYPGRISSGTRYEAKAIRRVARNSRYLTFSRLP